MRLCFMIYENGPLITGPTVSQRRLFHALQNHGHDIQILCLYHGSSPLHDYLHNNNFSTFRFPAGKYTHETISWVLKCIVELEPDIFIADWIAPGAMAGKWLRAAGIPTVGGLRSDDSYFWALMDRFANRNAGEWALSGVFCVNKDLGNRLKSNLSESTRSCVIPSGVPYPANVPPKRPPIRMVYLGRFEVRQKQILETTLAMCKAVKAIFNASGILVGNGPAEPAVLQIIKEEGCSAVIHVKEPVSPEDISGLLEDCNVIVLLSDYEGTPGALMDGMANGLVPVCMNCSGGVNALVKDGRSGLFVENRGNNFVKAIKKLNANENLLQELSTQARERIRGEYTLERTVQRWEGFLETLLSEAGPRRRLQIPRSIRLPRQHPDMLGFDYRPPSKIEIMTSKCRIALGAFKKTLFGRN